MNDIIKKNKTFLILVIYVVIIVIFHLFFLMPIITRIRSTADEIQKRLVDNEVILERIKHIQEMKKNSEIFKARKAEIDKAILKEGEELNFIEKMEALAEITQNKIFLDIEDNSAKATAKNKKKEEAPLPLPYDNYITVKINLEGNYENFINFLNRLENFENYVNPIAFSLNKVKQEKIVAEPKDIFSQNQEMTDTSSNEQENKEKEILKSTIEAIVYIKK